MSKGADEFRTGLFECSEASGCDGKLALCSCCCPCIQLGYNDERYSSPPGEFYGPSCIITGVLFGLQVFGLPTTFCMPCVSLWRRREMEKGWGLQRPVLHDCLSHCCCYPCSIAQDAREIKIRGPVPRLAAPPTTTML